MCGRYYIDDDVTDDDIVKLIGELKQQLAFMDDNDKIRLSGEIFPTDIVPIIANNKSLAPTPFMMKWGYSVRFGSYTSLSARFDADEKADSFSCF